MLDTGALSEFYKAVIAAGKNPPRTADLLFIAGQIRANELSVLDVAPDFQGLIGLPGHDGMEQTCGYPGFAHWQKEMVRRGVDSSLIVSIDGSVASSGGRIANTYTECEAMAEYVKNMEHVVVLAPYWHLARVFLTAAASVKRRNLSVKLSPMLGKALPWDEESVHSQGTVTGIRADFLVEEMIRIFAYQAKGDIASPEEGLAYLQ